MLRRAPERTVDERRSALEEANRVRFARAQTKRDLKSGALGIYDLLMDPSEELKGAKVEGMLLDLGALELLGGVHEEIVDPQGSALEVPLGLGPREAHPVGLLERAPAFVDRPFWCPPQHQQLSISSPGDTRLIGGASLLNYLPRRYRASSGGTSWSCACCRTSPWRTTCWFGSWSGRSTPNGSPRRPRSSSVPTSPWRRPPQRRRECCRAPPSLRPLRSQARAWSPHPGGLRAATLRN